MITANNCNKHYDKIRNQYTDILSKASAWEVVYNFCLENGMRETDTNPNENAIQQVIGFLEKSLKITI